jgi:hypothetical protein
MARHTGAHPHARDGETPRSLPAAGRRGRRVVRKIAQSTLLAAGIAATHMGFREAESRFHLFNPALVDRLQAPITRCRD